MPIQNPPTTCIVEKKVYIDSDDRRELVAKVHRCHRARGSRSCDRPEYRDSEHQRIAEQKPSMERGSDDAYRVEEGGDGDLLSYRDCSKQVPVTQDWYTKKYGGENADADLGPVRTLDKDKPSPRGPRERPSVGQTTPRSDGVRSALGGTHLGGPASNADIEAAIQQMNAVASSLDPAWGLYESTKHIWDQIGRDLGHILPDDPSMQSDGEAFGAFPDVETKLAILLATLLALELDGYHSLAAVLPLTQDLLISFSILLRQRAHSTGMQLWAPHFIVRQYKALILN
ncbi:hypothetical protein LTR85_006446 [Meristemomyces frigidus]|nr:hypothetical protein LTR85_006446 [Meristemomyces frigidus]